MKLVVGRSRLMLAYLLVSHSSSVLLLSLLSLPVWLKLFAGLLILLSLLHYCRRFQWLPAASAIIAVECNQQRHWSLVAANGNNIASLRLSRSVVMPWFACIMLQRAHERTSVAVVIAVDAVSREQWRQLRLILRDPGSWTL